MITRELRLDTRGGSQVIDITDDVRQHLVKSGLSDGIGLVSILKSVGE